MSDIIARRQPEFRIDGFTSNDGNWTFYSFVKAAMLRVGAREVLDFGAGRGAFWEEVQSHFIRNLHDLRTTGARVTAADIDPIVAMHPCSDRQIVIEPAKPLPFADQAFDLIVSDFTFEHIEQPAPLAAELLRVLRPGGYICARTPNRLGYVRLLAGLIPERLHQRALKHAQPERKSGDVFQAFYRLNSAAAVRAAFPGCEVIVMHDSADPSYWFGSRLLYRGFSLLHRCLPKPLRTTLYIFIRKPD